MLQHSKFFLGTIGAWAGVSFRSPKNFALFVKDSPYGQPPGTTSGGINSVGVMHCTGEDSANASRGTPPPNGQTLPFGETWIVGTTAVHTTGSVLLNMVRGESGGGGGDEVSSKPCKWDGSHHGMEGTRNKRGRVLHKSWLGTMRGMGRDLKEAT